MLVGDWANHTTGSDEESRIAFNPLLPTLGGGRKELGDTPQIPGSVPRHLKGEGDYPEAVLLFRMATICRISVQTSLSVQTSHDTPDRHS